MWYATMVGWEGALYVYGGLDDMSVSSSLYKFDVGMFDVVGVCW